ncbi:leucine-rich repeat-containing protein 57-like [Anneissia japonica]|uniref:leucine-rich repeat-containing protein 57-like n=1 Tax=Anneissia japonica TaxID=1529436 RepID=UPI0014258315|nr:leucine-rich repeat-containing protein 57-like [Anneissia japonica]XP_033110832.1 leucine-rich repeat-containing protein 57-like [Anneissia japonica]XP_033110833.1 leucine-rich repeat-containing protein 57-like [Anneissia japonica]XP_033110834.1 leucine-rich repeat-containing protein 57-like [Anneissia japonica]XP_033110835.1 leucine-rich repeat-containing protein 57-like [Anneissia japonica]
MSSTTDTRNTIHYKMRDARSSLILKLSSINFGSLPTESLMRLQKLEHLYLNQCSISGQPPNILTNFNNLSTLDLSSNAIDYIPGDFFKEKFQELKKLDLSYNKLNSIPSTINYLVNLEKLAVSNNGLIELAPQIGELRSLRMLDAGSNLIREVPGSLCAGRLARRLQHLNLSGNLLHTLPVEIGLLVKLEELNLERNQLSYLPASVRSLVKLKAFYYGENDWMVCPPTVHGVPTTNQASFGPLALEKIYSYIYPQM